MGDDTSRCVMVCHRRWGRRRRKGGRRMRLPSYLWVASMLALMPMIIWTRCMLFPMVSWLHRGLKDGVLDFRSFHSTPPVAPRKPPPRLYPRQVQEIINTTRLTRDQRFRIPSQSTPPRNADSMFLAHLRVRWPTNGACINAYRISSNSDPYIPMCPKYRERRRKK